MAEYGFGNLHSNSSYGSDISAIPSWYIHLLNDANIVETSCTPKACCLSLAPAASCCCCYPTTGKNESA